MDREPILVAMSGGVDSSVAAALLQRAGHPVVGVFMRGSLPASAPPAGRPRGCCSEIDAADVRRVADRLGIPFHVTDLSDGFESLKRYFADAYHQGLTPNPCIRCNRTLKFGALLDLADALGCRRVATGHYARREHDATGPILRRGLDRDKDQSYVLLSLDRATIARSCFPLGDYTKAEVRAMAADLGLPVAEKPESQEICFVPGDYRDYLRGRDPDRIRPGRFVDPSGRDLGPHPGHQLFTVGQRRGLGIAFGRPLYVVARHAARNEVVLGSREDLDAVGMTVGEAQWISTEPFAPGRAWPAEVQVRHRHRAVPCTVEVDADAASSGARLRIRFAAEIPAVAPGQGAAIYRDDVLLAGGWIEETRLQGGPAAVE